jgi:K+-transporting ATPase ATPase C chain
MRLTTSSRRAALAREAATSVRVTPPARGPREERWFHALAPALRTTAVTLALTGLLYPLAMTAIAQGLFRGRAGGSLVTDGAGKVVGSELIAQAFSSAGYFQPRPSAAGERGYDPLASGGSNLGATSRKLRDRAAGELERLLGENPDAPGPVPVELVTASGSGLDPHLSPAAALWQAPRVARARDVSVRRVRELVHEYTEGRDLGVLGEPRVNVLALNLALDRRFGAFAGAAEGSKR